MKKRSTGGGSILFLVTAIGFAVVALDLRDKQRQLDALRAGPGKHPHAAGPSNEEVAIEALRNLVSAQAMLQQSGRVDENDNGTGEYGGLLEITGTQRGRMHRKLRIPQLPPFRFDSEPAVATFAGYHYRVFLPDRAGLGVAEPPGGFARRTVDPENAERAWCCYAWPSKYGHTGKRAFVTNHYGEVHATNAAGYSGPSHGPSAMAAFADAEGIMGPVANRAAASDGNVWALED